MILTPILHQEEKQKIFQTYTISFPADERRNDDDFWQLFQHKNTEILGIYNNQCLVGYFIIWHLSCFVFVEHFEIFEAFRKGGLGTKALQMLAQKHPHLIIETEPEHLNEIAKSRVKFYQRNGFSILKKDYIQPSYGKGKSAINLWLIGNYPVKSLYLKHIIKELYQTVYDI